MADAVNEWERLAPTYNEGVLTLLRRDQSQMYIALLRYAFQPLGAELYKERLIMLFNEGLRQLTQANLIDQDTRDNPASPLHNGETLLVELSKEERGRYLWIASILDQHTQRYKYTITPRCRRAMDALEQLEDSTTMLSGAQTNSIIDVVERVRRKLTTDPAERIQLLENDITQRQHQIDLLKAGLDTETLTPRQVGDEIGVILRMLRGIPRELAELAMTEQHNASDIRLRQQDHNLDVDDILNLYHRDYRMAFEESEQGQRFHEAFQILFDEGGATQLADSIAAIRASNLVTDDNARLLNTVSMELERVESGILNVQDKRRQSDIAVQQLVNQVSNTVYRTMSTALTTLFTTAGHVTGPASASPFITQSAEGSYLPVPERALATVVNVDVPELGVSGDVEPFDVGDMIRRGGPQVRRIATLILEQPVLQDDGMIDLAASFNTLGAQDRRACEIVGLLTLDGRQEPGTSLWRCVGDDGTPVIWRTPSWIISADHLMAIVKDMT
ncbi:DUF3375 family protein [Bifidobacterium gallicum]|uniref:Methyl-accepting chemotaxis protein n=1 Tax=Bifidobacterium gallicum DSM 20093 = LMG 11596 TaxID=561180 RepID=D1NTS9_9BIFI|nr:DUF3375 family protein [Bifidobacterium gallicum]EFA23133.1 hypothetical protein BIFGAL_03246 [Bifidobacterium gallicum DSM 20093 = LMG 11596]KFI58809.1 methyl-accepting chemotaxis protein [Bifidobacterium gallicum DSM 20093 = LMG 11596]